MESIGTGESEGKSAETYQAEEPVRSGGDIFGEQGAAYTADNIEAAMTLRWSATRDILPSAG